MEIDQENSNHVEISAEYNRLRSVAPRWTPAQVRESVIDSFSMKWSMPKDEVAKIVDACLASAAIRTAPASSMRKVENYAYQVTEEDVENVLRSNSLAVANTNGKSFESIANEVFGNLDFDLIEHAALCGDDLDEQTDYANEETARQLREMGILEPLKEAVSDEQHQLEQPQG